MFFGVYQTNPTSSSRESYGHLSHLMGFEGGVTHSAELGKLSCGFILHPNLNQVQNEFIFKDESQQILVLLSGEIYNIGEITKASIENSRIIPSPERIFQLYQKHGIGIINQFNGDFALLIYDQAKDCLLLFRDHLGIRPISYCTTVDGLFFSSDGLLLSKALYGHLPVDPHYLRHQFYYYNKDLMHLPHPEVKRLLPGHFLEWKTEKCNTQPYWHPEEIVEADMDLNFLHQTIKQLLEDAVRIRSKKNLKAAGHLSGGIDSGIVTAMARKSYPKQESFEAYTWAMSGEVKGEGHDERVLIKELCEMANLDLVFSNLNVDHYKKALSSFWNMAEIPAELAQMEEMKRRGVQLVFSGWGGDEFISLNNAALDTDLFTKGQWKVLLAKYPLSNPKRLLGSFFKNVLLARSGYRLKPYRADEDIYHYLKEGKSGLKIPRKDRYAWKSKKDLHLYYLNSHHLAERAEDWYLNGYRKGILYRFPLLDVRIVTFMLQVPAAILSHPRYNRRLIREISEGLLPESMRWNQNKSDVATFSGLNEIERSVAASLVKEIPEFRKNPDLDFVDFDKLEREIEAFNKPGYPFNIYFRPILLHLKKVHEFTKGYYGGKGEIK